MITLPTDYWRAYLDYDECAAHGLSLTVGDQLIWRFAFDENPNVSPEWVTEIKWTATPLPWEYEGAYPTLLRARGMTAHWEASRQTRGSVRLTGELQPLPERSGRHHADRTSPPSARSSTHTTTSHGGWTT